MLAEKLWHEGSYAAAVAEYERVIQKDEMSELGTMATYRSAITQTLFLNEHAAAIKKFSRIIDLHRESPLAYESYKQIGDILFQKLEQYEQAYSHYQRMLQVYPSEPHRAEIRFRMAKCLFHLVRLPEAKLAFEAIVKEFPDSEWAEKADFEVGIILVADGNRTQSQDTKAANLKFKDAMQKFSDFQKKFPNSALKTQAQFEIGGIYEELEQLDAAQKAYEELKSTYPQPNLVELKLKRIQDRKRQKNL